MSLIKSEFLQKDDLKSPKKVDSDANGNTSEKTIKLKEINKSRRKLNQTDFGIKFCSFIKSEKPCPYGDKCCYEHDLEKYKELREPDMTGLCYNFDVKGFCSMGLTCRFASSHYSTEGENFRNEQKIRDYIPLRNILSKDTQKLLRDKRYDFSLSKNVSEAVVKEFKIKSNDADIALKSNDTAKEVLDTAMSMDLSNKRGSILIDDGEMQSLVNGPREKRILDLKDKLYLAPLTTLGNLPFRRICVEYGADVTCSEMAMAPRLLDGAQAEWALLKRHHTETLFGVQLCDSRSIVLAKAAQLVEEECEVDFIDLNCGCPLDMVCNRGSGCALIRNQNHGSSKNRLVQAVASMSRVLQQTPVTVKTRVGYDKEEFSVHSLLPRLHMAGAAAVTIHGRTRHQRYTKLADWQYIDRCVVEASPMPIIGNGDILGVEDWQEACTTGSGNLGGTMIGRGALIKPWLFSEIRQGRALDPSSAERLQMLRRFTNYGLEHWGSDSRGVETTRRFLLEWLSFLCRYIPLGVLTEPFRQRINVKLDGRFNGRDELETLMASHASGDWLRIAAMLLGPAPENFHFTPKHKANSISSARQ